MHSSNLPRLMALRESGFIEEAIRESQLMASECEDVNEKAGLMLNVQACYCMLNRLPDAEKVLQEIKTLIISDIEVRLNVDFSQACLLIQRGKTEEGLSTFNSMLRENGELLQSDHLRYLYEVCQFFCVNGQVLFLGWGAGEGCPFPCPSM